MMKTIIPEPSVSLIWHRVDRFLIKKKHLQCVISCVWVFLDNLYSKCTRILPEVMKTSKTQWNQLHPLPPLHRANGRSHENLLLSLWVTLWLMTAVRLATHHKPNTKTTAKLGRLTEGTRCPVKVLSSGVRHNHLFFNTLLIEISHRAYLYRG